MALKISRSRFELFLQCPRCFWLLINKGISRPSPAPYTINSAIDTLLKEQFDFYRSKGIAHPLMVRFGVDALPFKDSRLEDWRNSFIGIQCYDAVSDILLYGAVDDLWINKQKELIVVDYKATGANEHKVYDEYRRQMEIYKWLLEGNSLSVSPTGYLLFAKVNKKQKFENGVLNFDLILEPVKLKSDWIGQALFKMRKVLTAPLPASTEECEYCSYVNKCSDKINSPPIQKGRCLSQTP
ncbi:MAG: PD-(D/E)XK nuclease family protein [Candidatus Omnitrophica bacterium]|nr:PD-(D/E)XK nuclease family protein [Candidatus Omnitrophota bacterium]